ncbi:methionine-rich copper-binding protein CopC [Sedimentibacter acidaminivorans]|uniref:Methionine-rich copper-binding protein CopC n=1 Tax=Sedimentibacter acidaminivorans TaxID=913099 RepID=A0ABS4GBV1_9FIRM|nr:immunoglobulin-like domain-containing protein [Sedimentibacter acidaminivorans]MBP1925149.1 methionine-rich copper-binding protein CopC [Sedimentibacter acidaminivorans]
MKRIISLILVIMLLFTTNVQYVFANEDVYTDEVIVEMDTEWLTSDLVFGVGDYEEFATSDGEIIYYNINGNLNLPLVGENGSSLVWSSSDETFIEANGVIHKPSYLEGYKMVVITATLIKGTVQTEKLFVIELSPSEPTADEQAVQADYDWLVGEDVIHYGCFYNDIRSDVTMPTEGKNGSTITWASSDERWITIDGTVEQPPFSFAMGNAPVTLSAIISSGTVSKQKTFELEVVAQSPTEGDNVAIDKEWLTYENILNNNSQDNVKTRLSLPTKTERRWSPSGFYSGCNIAWESSNPNIVAVDGSVYRPTLSEGNQTVTLTATISYGEATDTKTFSFVVTAVEEFPLAIMYHSFDDSSRLQFNGISGTVVTTDRDDNEIIALQFNNDRVAEPTTGGSIFTKNKIRLGDDLSFSAAFSYKNPHPDFTKGEGGFIFTLQTVGNSIYVNDEDIGPSFNIAFNTDYYSAPGSGQSTGYGYIEKAAVYYNGDYEQRTEQYLASGSTNDSPTYNNVWIEYDGVSKVLEVRFSTDGIRPVNSNLKLENLELDQILTSAGYGLDIEDVREVYVGFMGSMGNAKDKSEIRSLYFKNDCTPIDFEPYNFIDVSNINLIANPPAGQASTTMSAIVCSVDGTPVSDIPVYFTTSFGMLDSSYEVTDDSGHASVELYSGISGTAQVKAYTTGGATALADVQLSANDTDRLFFDSSWLTGDRIKGENTTLSSVTVNLNLPLNAPNGSTISWESSNSDFLSTNGVVTRSSITQGDQSVTLKANISIGTESIRKTFNVKIKVCDDDLANADRDWLTDEIILGENESRDKIISDLTLPTIGENGSAISWRSDKVGAVALDGTVTRPSFTQGNQTVTLTATIKMGEVTLEKTFNITVIASEAIDEEIAYADFEWLTDEVILNENINLNEVLSSLTLPTVGVNGSQISWESTNEDFIKVDGTINRPTFSQGTQSIMLTATISEGSFEYTKIFNMLVLPLATDDEALSLDKEWLNYSRILGENSINNVTVNLNLPVLGLYGSSISWKSSNDTFIMPDGTVNRPTFTQGNKTVTLTASISKGGKTIDKSFLFSVEKLEQTDMEAVAADKRWLQVSRTLGGNLSQYSINQNLALPTLAPNGSLITWVSDMPSVISPNGEITIPEYSEGHKNVVLTATIEKGSVVESGIYKYTVLSKSDTFLPVVIETTPINNSDNVLWNTREITISFDEDIKLLTPINDIENYGIILNGLETPKISVSIFKNKLTVNLMDYLKAGAEYELIVPSNTIADNSNNYLDEELKISFSVEQKPENKIEVVSSTPNHMEKEISCDMDQLSFRYNYSNIIKGSGFEDISLLDISGNKVNATKSITNDTVTLALEKGINLKSGSVYEVAIPADAVIDRFENSSIGKSIKFRTKSSNTLPSVTGYYPNNSQSNVDIHQKIEINFSEAINAKDCNLVLLDDKGNKVNTEITTLRGVQNTVFMEAPYFDSLKPNTVYTVKGAYDSSEGSSDLGLEMSFATGDNKLYITKPSMLLGGDLPINTQIEIPFSASISEGDDFVNIKVMDSNNNQVNFRTSVIDNKLVLTPDSPLNPSETYAFYIPEGAVKNQADIENDSVKFFRTAAERLNYGSYSFYMPSTWVTEKVITFNARWLGEISRPLKSITWDFGDGKQGSGLFPANVYWHAGNYKVTLTLVDNRDISYKFEQNITINGLSLDDAKISVYPNDNCYFTVFEENNQYGLKNLEPFSITLYSPSIGYISDETVKVSLYKNGVFVENLGNIKTKYNGEAEFSFLYGNKDYFGGYELVFEHEGSKNQKIRVPVNFSEETKKQSMVIQLYNQEEGGIIDDPQDMYFELNGEKTLAQYEKIEGWSEGCYVIKGLETGVSYSLKLSSSEDVAYVTEEQEIYHQGSDYPVYLATKVKQPGLNYIKSTLTDSRVGNKYKGLFINNISIPNLYFELDGDWDGLAPGYYELKSSMGSISLKSDKPVFELQPSLQMQVGEELWGRMVSKSGVATLWQNANVIVAPYPSLDNGIKLDVSYINGKYIVDSFVTLSSLTGGKVDILDGVPLLDSAQSFGLGSTSNRFEGSINERGLLKLMYEYSSGRGMSTKKSKTLTTGYEVETDIAFYGSLKYDRFNKKWNLNYYYYYLSGRGEYYWKRPYTIPKLDIGGWGKVAICPNIDGRLAVYGNEYSNKDFEGILEFDPSVYVSIGAGIENTLSVEGYVTGSIPAEFHIPTGYIQVEPSISAGIDVYYIYDSSELYYKEIASTHWDNGKEKVILFSRQLINESKEDDIQLTSTARNYLERGSQWLVGSSKKQKSRMMAVSKAATVEEDKISLVTMTENIYPRAEVQQINGESEQWLVWTDDNPIRDANNRTQLKYSIYRDGSWLEPGWFGQDDTADFAPVAISLGDGVILAWQNIKNAMTEENKNVSYVKDSEISVTNSIYKANGNEPDIITLTDDEKFDHSPVIASDSTNAILVWTKSEGLSLTFGEDMDALHSPANSDCLYSSVWDGNSWSTPEEIESSLPTILDSSLTMHKEEGLLTYTLDTDNDLSTQDDREVYYRIYDGTAWGDAIQLSNNNVEDSVPKAVNINNEWFVIWQQNGHVMYKIGLSGETKTDENLSKVPNNYKIAIMEGDDPQLAIVYANTNQDNTTSLLASFYDIKKGIWSNPIALSENTGYIRSFSLIFTNEGKLDVVYTKAEVINKVIEETSFLSPSDKVDLMLLSYTPKHDIALGEVSNLQLTPSIPVKGALTTVSAVVKNLGDFAENATLYLYDGNPDNGNLLGETATTKPIAAGSMAQLEVEWLVGLEEKSEYELYAIVRSDGGIHDANENNNTLSLKIATSDIAVINVDCENMAGNDYLAKATVANTGSTILEDVDVQVKHEKSGQILGSKSIDQIMPGQKIDLSFLFTSSGLIEDKDGEINMYVCTKLSNAEEEYSTENNIYRFTLEQAVITVDKIEPSPNETQINIAKPITISFNMNVEPGLEFGVIELYDNDLNEVDIKRELNGRILTITPQNSLAYSTGYTLTLPEKVVSDSYGHTMNESYSQHFVTTSSNPEIIFAYPGDGMTDIALDTELKVKFNQNVMSGQTFDNIAMYTKDLKKVSISTLIDGEWLYVNLVGHLSGGTAYSLVIPGGAVKNVNNEMLEEDYTLNFTTIVSKDNNNKSDSHFVQQEYKVSKDEKGIVTIDITKQALLKAPYIISIPYTPTTEEMLNPESIIIRYVDNSGNLVVVPDGHYDSDTGVLVFNITSFSHYVVSFNKVDFSDVASDAWYRKAVNYIAARGITSGTGYGKYSPDAKLTRSDFLVLLMRSYSIAPDVNTTDNFVDSGNTYYTNYLATAKKLGITAGVGNNMFLPEKEITRQEMFTLLYNALNVIGRLPKQTSDKTLSDFADEELVDSWAKEAMTLLIETGTISGNAGKLSPISTTTRAEMAQVLYNMLSR